MIERVLKYLKGEEIIADVPNGWGVLMVDGYPIGGYKVNDLEKTDEKIRELVDKNYTTIVVSNEVASFSEDIIKKYNRIESVNIIIAPGHNKDNYT